MMAAVHALVGSALSRLCRTRTQAFALGVLSHVAADLLPHRDLDIPEEALFLAGALTVVTAARGADSQEFAGAFGAALPDIENAVGRILGVNDKRMLLPTHSRYHGRETLGFRGQIALALACLAVLALPSSVADSG